MCISEEQKFTLEEQRALNRFCHNAWKYALFSSFPILAHKSFNIQWDLLNCCGNIIYIDNTIFGNKEKKIPISSEYFHLLCTIQNYVKKYVENTVKDEIQYVEEMEERYRERAQDLWIITQEGVKYALKFLAPDYQCDDNKKSEIIYTILTIAWIKNQRSKIASELRKRLIPKDESWSFWL